MNNAKKRFKDQPYYKYWGDWKFINPYWIFILAIIYVGVQVGLDRLVGDSGIRISNDIFIQRTIAGSAEKIPSIGIIVAIVNLVLIVAILYISVSVLPNGNEHNRLRLAGIFVMEGLVFKAVAAVVWLDMSFHIEVGESFKLPMLTAADLYLLGGIIAIIIIFKKNYSNQEIEEIVEAWKTKRQEKNN